jgi:hypothetical protein
MQVERAALRSLMGMRLTLKHRRLHTVLLEDPRKGQTARTGANNGNAK